MAGGFTRSLKKRKIVLLLFVFSFIVSGLFVNLLELFTVPLYFINRRWFRIVNTRLVYLYWCGKCMVNNLLCVLCWLLYKFTVPQDTCIAYNSLDQEQRKTPQR